MELLDYGSGERIGDGNFLFEECFDLPADVLGRESVGLRINGDEASGVCWTAAGPFKGGRDEDETVSIA